ncbi:hypothetical protein CDAR_175021 [Caerostris darwini]|uniref:Uncharacterized protein n=1 Tax=Caerostris darwini TaxID=1538125 RepID=A0AAV4W239_9ARAC|nr:hypothetical protein CDAR_175021 [Caerostris darwini]
MLLKLPNIVPTFAVSYGSLVHFNSIVYKIWGLDNLGLAYDHHYFLIYLALISSYKRPFHAATDLILRISIPTANVCKMLNILEDFTDQCIACLKCA